MEEETKLKALKRQWNDEIKRVEELQKLSVGSYDFNIRRDYILELKAKLRAFEEIKQARAE